VEKTNRLNRGLPDVNPNVAEIYSRKVRELAEALGEEETSLETADTLRSLIGEVILYPGENRGQANATLRGELLGIPDFAQSRNTPRTHAYPLSSGGGRRLS
jgi:hypothetical protein